MRLTREARQRIVDEYLDATGAESVRPRDFLAWLEPLEDHAAWRLFFGRDEAAGGSVAALEQFVDLNDEAAVPPEDRAAAGGRG